MKILHSPKGYTLIELMLVITIMGLVTAAVTVNFNEVRRARELSTAAEDLVTTLKDVQSMASTGRTVSACRTIVEGAVCNGPDSCKDADRTGSCESVVPPGFGIHFIRCSPSTNCNYTIFADSRPGSERAYNEKEAMRAPTLGSHVIVGDIRISGESREVVDVVFSPPEPVTWIAGRSDGVVIIVLEHTVTHAQKKVMVASVLGRITIQ